MALRGFNKYIHPRNRYKTAPDVEQLVREFPEIEKYAVKMNNGKLSFDFKNPEALRIYTQTLLKRDFGLEVTIPTDRLVPTLTLRLNYILWIEDLLNLLTRDKTRVKGIDIGTGASCIYPLLGNKMNGWQFVAIETDEKSLEFAEKNIKNNHLENDIKLIPVQENTFLYSSVEDNSEAPFDFCMCNPPFFSSLDEAIGKHKNSTHSPNPNNTASDREMVTDGGESEFVKKIIEDSVKLQEKIKIFTTMLGKKSSMKIIKRFLIKNNINAFTTTQFCQGKTMRWGIAWTFLDGIDFKQATLKKPDTKPPFKLSIPNTMKPYTKLNVTIKLKRLFNELSIECVERKTRKLSFEIIAKENTWIHQRRKRRQEEREKKNDAETSKISDSQTSKRSLDDAGSSPEAKKQRPNDDSNALEAKLVLNKSDTLLNLDMYFVDGYLGRAGLYQLLQFLKNKLK